MCNLANRFLGFSQLRGPPCFSSPLRNINPHNSVLTTYYSKTPLTMKINQSTGFHPQPPLCCLMILTLLAISTSSALLVPYEAHHVQKYHSWMQDPVGHSQSLPASTGHTLHSNTRIGYPRSNSLRANDPRRGIRKPAIVAHIQ